MTTDKATLEALTAVARIDATLDAIKANQDHGARTAEQLVRLVEERLTSKFEAVGVRFDTIERRLNDMDTSRGEARKEHAAEVVALALRVTAIEQWKDKLSNRVWGFAIGVTLAAGGVAGTISTFLNRWTQ